MWRIFQREMQQTQHRMNGMPMNSHEFNRGSISCRSRCFLGERKSQSFIFEAENIIESDTLESIMLMNRFSREKIMKKLRPGFQSLLKRHLHDYDFG